MKVIIFKGNPILNGNKCKDFENIPHFFCYPSIALNCSDELKKSNKILTINDKCVEIEKQSFKNWVGLRQINLPISLKVIGEEAFANCVNLYRIEIPDSVNEIKQNSFFGCNNLYEIECNGKFLNCFPFEKVKFLKIKNNTQEIDSNS